MSSASVFGQLFLYNRIVKTEILLNFLFGKMVCKHGMIPNLNDFLIPNLNHSDLGVNC